MFEASILIPVTDNDGVPFTSDDYAAFESAAMSSFGGYSIDANLWRGAWRNAEGVEFRDVSRVYIVGVSSIEQGTALVALARLAMAEFRQLAIAIRYLGQLEIIE